MKAHISHNSMMTSVKKSTSHNGNHEERVLELMRERAKKREDELRKYDHNGSYIHYDSDEDSNSSGPIFDS